MLEWAGSQTINTRLRSSAENSVPANREGDQHGQGDAYVHSVDCLKAAHHKGDAQSTTFQQVRWLIKWSLLCATNLHWHEHTKLRSALLIYKAVERTSARMTNCGGQTIVPIDTDTKTAVPDISGLEYHRLRIFLVPLMPTTKKLLTYSKLWLSHWNTTFYICVPWKPNVLHHTRLYACVTNNNTNNSTTHWWQWFSYWQQHRTRHSTRWHRLHARARELCMDKPQSTV